MSDEFDDYKEAQFLARVVEGNRFRPGVYRLKHSFTNQEVFATAEIWPIEPTLVRFDFPDGTWDTWPLDSWSNDWEWVRA
jgi:hypothetical protein